MVDVHQCKNLSDNVVLGKEPENHGNLHTWHPLSNRSLMESQIFSFSNGFINHLLLILLEQKKHILFIIWNPQSIGICYGIPQLSVYSHGYVSHPILLNNFTLIKK